MTAIINESISVKSNITKKESEKILFGFNKTEMEYPADKTFVDLFEEQVEKAPDNIALVYKYKHLTYKQLNEKANQLARLLRDKGVKPDTTVGIMVDRSTEMIIATLAILKAGGAYLPIEISYPKDRIQYILENSKSPIVLTQSRFKEKLEINAEIIDLEAENIFKGDSSNLEAVSRPNNLAYVIYTSGSTGKPKGVMIEHKALLNMSWYHIQHVGLTEEDNVSKNAAFGFDASVLEIFPTLIAGASIYVIPEEIKLSLKDLNEYFEANNITMCFFTTLFGEQFMDIVDNASLKYVIVGGEKLKTFKPRNYKLLNIYGPTEYTVYTTSYVVKAAMDNIPIGEPLGNTRIYILNEKDEIVPIGEPGELCVSGDNIARGYLNRAELTNEKFVNNPFEPGNKMYRTGDLVRWLPDGNIEYVGRKDFQVKFRGYRIELGEIEQEILKIDNIKETVVIDRDDEKGNKYLAGYFVATKTFDNNKIKEFLSVSLPEYMVPTYIIQLDKMPLTPNGKVDRKALPEPVISKADMVDYIAPVTDLEIKLVKIWQEVLGIENIGVNDNFYNLGGHSLKAVAVQAKIEKETGVNLPLNKIFKHPTIKELSEIIPALSKRVYKDIEPLKKQEYYDLSSSQKRLYFIEQMQGIGTTYNVPFIVEITGSLNPNKLSLALDKLVNRHEALRTSFEVIDGQPKQIIKDRVNLKKVLRNGSEEDLVHFVDSFIRPFDLSKAPLFRAELINIEDKKHYLLIDFHHIIVDGVSIVNIINDLATFYNDSEPAKLKIQYKDFAAWQNDFIASDNIKEQENYWLKQFEGEIPVLELPTDYPYPSTLDYIGDEITIKLDKKLTKSLNKFCAQSRTTLFMLLMAAFNVFLQKYTSQEDIIVGTPIAARNHPDLENVVGMFVNTIPIRSYPDSEKVFVDLLNEINNNCLTAFENTDYQLDTLIDKLNIKRNSSKHPLFDVCLVLQNMGINEMDAGEISFNPAYHKKEDAKFDILLEILENEETLTINWNYRTSLFEKETIKRMAGHFTNILNTIIEKPEQKIKDINMLSQAEELQLLFDFNDTEVEYPRNISIHQMFEDQVTKYPDHVAVTYEDQSITYKDLNIKANHLAHYLRGKGVKQDTIIAIMLDRSINMITGLLGILKAGGCYLPINPDYPEDRTNYILENSQAPFLLTTKNYFESVTLNGEKIDIDEESIYQGNSSNLENINDPEDLAYIIYTSGSTGKPKGVMIQHKNVIRLLKNDKDLYDFSDSDVWTMFHSFCFDFSVWEIYGAILFGGKLVIVPPKATLSPDEFLKVLKKEKVTVLNQTPGAFYNLIEEDLKSESKDLYIRYVIFGGEALKPILLKEWHKKYPQTKLINMYGITETTVHVTFKEITDYEIDNNISNIGVPIPTLTTYIMDKNSKLAPIGVVGEICVGGDGVARGYVQNPELTAIRFIKNPYPPHDRIYRSGDLAKILPNGEMVYFGRIDFQVKIRGFRIELAEIEDKLLKSDNIKKVIVLAKELADGNKVLVAYLVMENDMSIPELRDYLSEDLPGYMIPSYFVKMDDLPLTSNGKVDRKALPDPTGKVETGIQYVAPENAIQKNVVKIWQEVLGVEKIGINDNFFALGGHSLKAVTLVAELQKYYKVTVNDIFEHQTIAELAENIEPISDKVKTTLEKLKSLSVQEKTDISKDPEIAPLVDAYNLKNQLYQTKNLSLKKVYSNIMITGTTGYLGVHLLMGLLKSTTANISCIVRGNTYDEAKERLVKKLNYYFGENIYNEYSNRIKVLNGQIAEDKFGLPDNIYSELAKNIDCIIHSAAIVRHYGHYDEFYKSNVKATINLLDFAKDTTQKDFNHISTISVGMGNVENKNSVLFTEYDSDINQKCDNYYVKTKLEAEQQVISARDSGLITNIFRIGNISINSENGRLQDNIEENAFFSTVKSFVNLGIIPDVNDEADISFVDQVTDSILTLYDKVELSNETYHIENSQIVKLSEVLSSDKLNLNIDKVSFNKFVEHLCKNYDKEALRPYIENILLHKGWLSEDDSATDYLVLNNKTELILKKLGFEWKKVDPDQLNNMIIKSLEDRVSFIKSVPIFKDLKQEDLDLIARVSREIVFDQDSDIVVEDQPNKNLYIVKEGYVEMCRQSKLGWLGTIMVLNEGEFFDEDIFKKEEVSTLTGQAILDDAVVLAIKDEDLFKLVQRSPTFSLSFLGAMSERLSRMEKMIISIG